MSRLYWLLNLMLIVVAVIGSVQLSQHRPQSRWHMPKAAAALDSREAELALAPVPLEYTAPSPVLNYLDGLWQQSLFRPERTEDMEVAEGAVEAVPQGSTDLELIGVGIIGKDAAAIILIKENPGRRTPGRQEDKRTRAAGNRHVFRKGAAVGDTGYVLKDISLNRVVLQRGSEERVLQLESSDAASAERSAKAVAATTEKKAESEAVAAKAEAKTDSLMPPPPPPPPPMPMIGGNPAAAGGGATTPGTAPAETLSKEERIRRALEARKRILEQRQTEEGNR